ncbi:MAG: cytochrome c biogenesis protein CcsA, partial [Actinomycetota bacterium]
IATALVAWLGYQFAVEDWSSVYVADHARAGTNPLLRIAGLWAGAEGSLLLWLAMVAWAAVIATALAPEPARAAVGRFGAALTLGYGVVLARTASPFERLPAPANGGLGLQPVLEHPAMIWHPPLLYGGLVGLLIPLLIGLGAAWSQPTSRWPRGRDRSTATVVVGGALAVLTVGLATGALWADVELGWGGFWAWDPIESAGLVAWLAGVALLHSIRRSDAVSSTRVAITLTLLPGLAAVGATTVTRIGVVASVHAFADRPALRVGLILVAAAVVAAVIGAVARADGPAGAADRSGGTDDVVRGRRWAVTALAIAAVFVAVGTYEPVAEAATTGDRLAIAGAYYTRLLWPVTIGGAALAVRADRRWWPAGAGAVLAAMVTPWAAGPFGFAVSLAGGAVAGSAVSLLGRRRPGALAHAGVGLALVGVAGTMAA